MCFFFQKYGYTHLSAGELSVMKGNPDSQYGELIEKYIKDGKIVPVEITISLLRRVRSVNAENSLNQQGNEKLNLPFFL